MTSPLRFILRRIGPALLLAAPATLFAQPLCSPGSWSPTGKQPCTLASPGYYVAGTGAKSQTAAAPGRYVPTAGAKQPIIAAKGFYVPNAAATQQTPASAGYYVPTTGAASQIAASAGYYVPSPGATSQIPAPLGYYVPTKAATAPTISPAGFYVPTVGATKALVAPFGYYAPNTGMSAPIAAGLGFYVPLEKQIAETPASPGFYVGKKASKIQTLCPSSTNSYGQAPACRFVGGVNMPVVPGSIGPIFLASFTPGSTIDVGYFGVGQSVSFQAWIQNASNNLQQLLGATPSAPQVLKLTQLSLIGTTVGAVPQVQTTVFNLPAGTVLGEGAVQPFSVSLKGLAPGQFTEVLTFQTDEAANFGQPGASFQVNVTGTVTPEPTTIALVSLGLAGLGVAARRRRTA